MMRRWLTILLLLAILPSGAWAQDEDEALMPEGLDGEFTVGGAGVVGQTDSFKFGEYTGINDDTGYFIGSTNLTYNRGSYFMNLFTEDLGLDNRSIYWETGQTGSYTVYAQYNQIPHLFNDNTLTQFQQPGGTLLTLNPGMAPATNTSTLNIVNRDFELQNERDTGLFGIQSTFGKFIFDLNYQRTERDGTHSIGGAGGDSANPAVIRSTILPDPIEQVAHEIHASLLRSYHAGQVQLNFDYSLFNNELTSVNWQNPFNNHPSQAPTNRISRDPDNQSWRVGLTATHNLSDTTRIAGMFQYGVMDQDEPLLPFSFDSSTALLPRAQADALIQTIHGTLNLSSRPLPKLALNLRFRHYQTINDTPIQGFRYIINDEPGGAAAQVATPVNNLPFDMTQNQVNATASYYAFKGTTFKLGYKFDHRKRDFREVDETKENAITAGFRSSYFKNVNLSYNVTLGVREEVDPYDTSKVFQARFGTPGFDTHPLMKRYDISEREQMKHAANITYSPTGRTSYGIYYNFVFDDYDSSQLGMQFSRRHDVTFDWTYTPSDNTTINAYYTFENIQTEQLNQEFVSFGACNAPSIPACNWIANHDNDAHTVGAGVSHQYAENRVKLSLDYWFSDSVEDITFTTGANLTSVDMPKLKTRNHNARFTGRYRWKPNVDFSLQYLYQRFQIDDFATDNFNPGSATIPEVLTLFGTLPNFDGHIIMAYFTYRIGATKK